MYNTGAKATPSRDVRKGSWTDEEDNLLRKCIEKFGEGNWHRVPLRAGLNRCRKSCRLRWMNYLKPNIKRGQFNVDEVDLIIRLHKLLGNRWSLIAGRIPGRTANDVKNYWNTHLHKKSSPLPPKHPNTMNNIISIKNNVKESHKKQATLPTTTSKNTIPMHPKIIRPKPWTFPRAPYLETRKPAPLIMGRPNRPINGPSEESVSRNSLDKEHEEKEEGEDDDAKAKWWENLVEMYEKEENEELNGSKDGLGFQEPNNPRVLKMWAMSCSEVLPSSSNPVEERNIWEDDDLWNFDVNVWE